MRSTRSSRRTPRSSSRTTSRRAASSPDVELSVLDYVVLVVDDLDRSLAFYTGTLGLTLDHRSDPYAQLATGQTRLALFERSAMAATIGREQLERPDREAPGFELGFKVHDVDAAYAELMSAGAVAAVGPTDRPWGQRTAYVRDPDGYLIELAQDLGGRDVG
ncbi:MAG: VOC family protein [Actinobacteria bacterium]|nr:VOC family protein [Actinomycetota bacterium]